MVNLKDKLLSRIQANFPLSPAPYKDLAEEFDVTEDDIINAISELKMQGLIRRIGASIDSRKAGYVSTLVGCKVQPDKLAEVAKEVGKNPGVTHAYERADAINFWFTLIEKDKAKLEEAIDEYSRLPGIEELYSLPAEKVYKIDVRFNVSNE